MAVYWVDKSGRESNCCTIERRFFMPEDKEIEDIEITYKIIEKALAKDQWGHQVVLEKEHIVSDDNLFLKTLYGILDNFLNLRRVVTVNNNLTVGEVSEVLAYKITTYNHILGGVSSKKLVYKIIPYPEEDHDEVQ